MAKQAPVVRRYDASKELKPFANRGKGGALIEDAFPQHPRTRQGKRASSRGKSRGTPNVRIRTVDAKGVYWTRLRDGVKITKGAA